MRLVFLDFDGVIVTGVPDHKTGNPDAIAALNYITDRSGANIVVSSAWRIGSTVEGLRQKLSSWGVRGEVIGKTPMNSLTRGSQIERWIDQQGFEVEEFVILDDRNDMANLESYLVQTKYPEGLTMRHANRALRKLGIRD